MIFQMSYNKPAYKNTMNSTLHLNRFLQYNTQKCLSSCIEKSENNT